MENEIKKEVPGGISQPDTIQNHCYYNKTPEESQEEELEWTLGDLSLRAGHLNPKKWPNAQDYRININHPDIKPIYKRFCFLVTGRNQYPISDTQRFEFERMVKSVLTLFDKTKEEKIRLLCWEVESIPKSPYWFPVPSVPSGRHLEHERFADIFQNPSTAKAVPLPYPEGGKEEGIMCTNSKIKNAVRIGVSDSIKILILGPEEIQKCRTYRER